MSIWYSTPIVPDGTPLQRGAWMEALDVATATGWRPHDAGYVHFTAKEGRELSVIWRKAIATDNGQLNFAHTLERLACDWSGGPFVWSVHRFRSISCVSNASNRRS